MAVATPASVVLSSTETQFPSRKRTSVKALVESSGLTSIPSNYSYSTQLNEFAGSEPDDSLPIIDFSLLTSTDPDQRSKAIQDLGKACEEWGFFMLVNHGVPESLTKAVINGCGEFFKLPSEDKQEFIGKDVWEPIRCGTGVDVRVEKFFFWRDFLKVFAHPKFHFPSNPQGFSELAQEYCKRTREVAMELLRRVSESLGLEESYIEKAMNLDSGLQLFAANLYPPCPQPDLAIGIPVHTDHGLLTVLTENEMGGLQIQHNGKWFNVNSIRNSFLINTGDHLEILSNGKYKSVMHRAIVNNKATRISIAVPHGPSLNTVVSPAPELLEREGRSPAYMGMTYKEYMQLQLDGKPCLDRIRL